MTANQPASPSALSVSPRGVADSTICFTSHRDGMNLTTLFQLCAIRRKTLRVRKWVWGVGRVHFGLGLFQACFSRRKKQEWVDMKGGGNEGLRKVRCMDLYAE